MAWFWLDCLLAVTATEDADTSVKEEVSTMAAVKLTAAGAIRDIAERVGWTFAQNFVTVLLATGSAGLYTHQAWGKASMVGLWAALFALVTTTLAIMVQWHPGGYAAVFDRGARTFLQTFLAVMMTSEFTSFTDAGALSALATAAATAFLAALKSLVGLANAATFADSTAVEMSPRHVRT
jgi:hypothetical protein